MDALLEIVRNLPDSPGVYQFFNEKQQIIYVGKAKSLKRRVSSYFQSSHLDNAKVRVMVSKIADIKFILVETESDALLLENNLIKKYLPRYNILLKDDKTFPWICIRNERFPRIYSTRTVLKDGSIYYGPYTSAVMVRTLLAFIRQLFPLRSCTLPLVQEHIDTGKYKVCLEYHIGNCKAPCIGNQSEVDYLEAIEQIKSILQGNLQQVKLYLNKTMSVFAGQFRFEEAEKIRRKIIIIDSFQSKSTIVNPSINNIDVFSFVDNPNFAVVNFLKINSGSIVQAHTIELVKRLQEDSSELLGLAIVDIRERFHSMSSEIIVSFLPDFDLKGVHILVPQRGDKKKLLELSERNARYYLMERNRALEKANREDRTNRILSGMQNDLRLSELPVHIECFDNSNILGTNPVSSCVVFKNARPAKRDYRHYNIKTVEGPNDFASMEEVVYRRYKRLLDEKSNLPQLIVIDGGKGQLHAALDSLDKLQLHGKIAIIGIAKRLEEIFFPGDPVPVYLDKKSETLKIIQQLRDEAHRFGIGFHRDKRSASMVSSVLDDIKGIGKKTKELLFQTFRSIDIMKNTPKDEMEKIIGPSKTEILLTFFRNLPE